MSRDRERARERERVRERERDRKRYEVKLSDTVLIYSQVIFLLSSLIKNITSEWGLISIPL